MLFKKPSDIPSSEITPKSLYLNRRSFIAGAGALAGSALVTHKLGTILAPSEAVMAGTKLDFSKSSYSTSDPETPFKDVTNYNNYYEFSTDKYEPAALPNSRLTQSWIAVREIKAVVADTTRSLCALLREHAAACHVRRHDVVVAVAHVGEINLTSGK